MKVDLKMGEDNCPDSSRKILGDVKNQLGKRRFLSISGGSCLKSGDGYSENVDKKVGKKSSVVNEKDRVKRVCVSPRPCSEIYSLKGNVISGISKISSENKDPNLMDSSKGDVVIKSSIRAGDHLRGGCVAEVSKVACESKDPISLDLAKGDSVAKTIFQVGDDLRENIVSGVSKIPSEDEDLNMLEVSSGADVTESALQAGDELGDHCVAGVSVLNSGSNKDCVDLGENCDVGEGIVGSENTQSNADVCRDEDDCHVGEDCVMSQTGSIDYARLPESQESRCFGLERCTALKGDGCSNSSAAIDMIKACTCSFCTKAAYIWTDLHYQDLKGRIAAIKKSEKEASLLVERSCRSLGTDKHGMRNSTGASNLESELTGQWRSLFVQMENIFEREGNQLEDNLLPLKDLREKCKSDLELLNGPIP